MADPSEQTPSPDRAEEPVRRPRWAAQPLVGVELHKGRLAEGLAARLGALIEAGVWPDGMKLPSTRTLARDHGISRNTAIAALGILATEGLIGMRDRSVAHVLPGKVKVSPVPASAVAAPARAPLHAFDIGNARRAPVPEWAMIERRLWLDSAELLAAAPVQGLAGLRREIGHALLGVRGLRADPERLIVTESNVQSLRLVLDGAVQPPARVLLDGQAFDLDQAMALAELLGRPVELAASADVLDHRGRGALAFITSLLLRRVNSAPVRAGERRALLAWAEREDKVLIELDQDWAALPPAVLRGPSLAAGSDRVFHLTGVGRMISPDLPVAAIVCPPRAVERLVAIRAATRGAMNSGLQAGVMIFLQEGYLGPHLRRRAASMAAPVPGLARAARASLGAVADVRAAMHRDSVLLRIPDDQADRLASSLRTSGFWLTRIATGAGTTRLRVTLGESGRDNGQVAMMMAAAARLFGRA